MDDRQKAVQERAATAFTSLLDDIVALEVGSGEHVDSDEIVDVRESAMSGADEVEWVTVAEAADRAGVSTSAVRQWYRSGHLATQRSDDDRRAFLVPMSDVLRLARTAGSPGSPAPDVDEEADEDDDLPESVIDINASYWATETEAARAEAEEARQTADVARSEARRLAADLEDARLQIESAREAVRTAREEAAAGGRAKAELDREVAFLRQQLHEANEELRASKADVARLTAALEQSKRSATFGSVTSTAWVEEVDKGYRGPLRQQDPLGAVSYEDDIEADSYRSDDLVAGEEPAAIPEALTRPLVYGDAEDDLLPVDEDEKPRRRRR